MAADLHIHVLTDDMSEDDLACFFGNTLGSKHFDLSGRNCNEPRVITDDMDDWLKEYRQRPTTYGCGHTDRVDDSPNIWIGEVSWLKAALFEDDRFIPDPVNEVFELIGENLPVLDEELKGKILDAIGAPNTTGYETTQREKVEEFLNEHMGKRLFTVSW